MKKHYHWHGDKLYLDVYLQPRAKKDEIVGDYNHQLKIRLMAPPIDGKANEYLITFIAHHFGVAKQKVKLTKGEHSRSKQLCIESPQVNLDIYP